MGLRVCEAGGQIPCGVVLHEAPLSVGEIANVCTVADTIVYQEAAPGSPYGPLVEAVCDGADVEI